jgi:hypothetical protein
VKKYQFFTVKGIVQIFANCKFNKISGEYDSDDAKEKMMFKNVKKKCQI